MTGVAMSEPMHLAGPSPPRSLRRPWTSRVTAADAVEPAATTVEDAHAAAAVPAINMSDQTISCD